MIQIFFLSIFIHFQIWASQSTTCDEEKLIHAKALFRCENQFSAKECNSTELAVLGAGAGAAAIAVIDPVQLQQMKQVSEFHAKLVETRKTIASEHKQILDEYAKHLKKNKSTFREGAIEIEMRDLTALLPELTKKFPNNGLLKQLIEKNRTHATDRSVAFNDVIQAEFSRLYSSAKEKLGSGNKFSKLATRLMGEHLGYALNDMKIAFAKKAYSHQSEVLESKVKALQEGNKTIAFEGSENTSQIKSISRFLAKLKLAGGIAKTAAAAGAAAAADIAAAAGQSFEKNNLLNCLSENNIQLSVEASSLLYQNIQWVQPLNSARPGPICERINVKADFIDFISFSDSKDMDQLKKFICHLYDNRLAAYEKTFSKSRKLFFDPNQSLDKTQETVATCSGISTPLKGKDGSFVEIKIDETNGYWSIDQLKSNNGECRNWIDTHIRYNPTYYRLQKAQLFQPQFICQNIDQNECRKAVCQLSRAVIDYSQNAEIRRLQCAYLEDQKKSASLRSSLQNSNSSNSKTLKNSSGSTQQ